MLHPDLTVLDLLPIPRKWELRLSSENQLDAGNEYNRSEDKSDACRVQVVQADYRSSDRTRQRGDSVKSQIRRGKLAAEKSSDEADCGIGQNKRR
ncbi:hypothetical protein [Bradyrhizobium sp. AC87j1]|uniref:hypothetical protein n=1 Tax=Bradyrhizobium sp. AC87j1 TaxID=2055894 RepID=UPI001FE0A51C|nr:hypothetical protein [Bradyrhizobium sp. AC87j1]